AKGLRFYQLRCEISCGPHPRSQAPAWERTCLRSSSFVGHRLPVDTSAMRSWSFAPKGIPKLELGNEADPEQSARSVSAKTPTAFHHPAQGWRAAPTLGIRKPAANPERVVSSRRSPRCNPFRDLCERR